MCISDSVDTAGKALKPAGFTADGGADVVDIPQRAQVQPAARADEPVSYTHLSYAVPKGQTIRMNTRFTW